MNEKGVPSVARRSRREDPRGRRQLERLDAFGMSKLRLLLVHCVLALLVGGSLWALVADQERWPFSPYPMYSTIVDGEALTRLRPYGVTANEPRREIPLNDPRYAQSVLPFYAKRLDWAFSEIASSYEDDPEKKQRALEVALLDVLKRYEDLRLGGHHDGPPLRVVKLYAMQWRLDAGAGNVNQPDKRQLLVKANLKPRSGP